MRVNVETPLDLARRDLRATRQPLIGLMGREAGAKRYREASKYCDAFRDSPDPHTRAVAFASLRLRRLYTAAERKREADGRRVAGSRDAARYKS